MIHTFYHGGAIHDVVDKKHRQQSNYGAQFIRGHHHAKRATTAMG